MGDAVRHRSGASARRSSAPSTSTTAVRADDVCTSAARQRHRRHRQLPQARPQPVAHRHVPCRRTRRRRRAHRLHRLRRRGARAGERRRGPVDPLRGVAPLNRPIMVIALRGWFDVAEVATTAINELFADRVAPIVASIDPDPFFDFTQERPLVELDEDEIRQIHWPENEFRFARFPGAPHDLVVLAGVEPHLRYATFADSVLEVAKLSKCEVVVTVGAVAEACRTPGRRWSSAAPPTPDLVTALGLSPPAVPGHHRSGRRAAGATRPRRACRRCRCASACRTTSATRSIRSRRSRCCTTSSTCSACRPDTARLAAEAARWRVAARRGRRRGRAGDRVRGDARARIRPALRGGDPHRRRSRPPSSSGSCATSATTRAKAAAPISRTLLRHVVQAEPPGPAMDGIEHALRVELQPRSQGGSAMDHRLARSAGGVGRARRGSRARRALEEH